MAGRLTIGIDMGGTQVRVALVEEGRILRRAATRTDALGGPVAVLEQFRKLISEICAPDDWARLAGVGISAPGPLDGETGTILHIPTLPHWESVALREILAADFGLPVVLENDGIAAAYGEWKYGAGTGLRHLVYVTVSTGIGGGIVVDGHLMHGRRGMAGHVGHFHMSAEGPVCSCGAVGCFEAFASGTSLGRRAITMAEINPDSLLGKWSASAAIDARHVVEGARQGDSLCQELLREEAAYLGSGFTSLIHLFSPERVIMGGGVSNGFDLMQQGIHDVIRRDAMEPFKTVQVVPAGLGDNSGLVGAAALACTAGQG
jgi:glucokinase